MMRNVLALLAITLTTAAWPASASQDHPDLTGTWKLQQGTDSLPPVARRRPPAIASDDARDLGRPPEDGPRRGPGDSLGLGSARTLTIAQTDSTVTIAGERLPSRTYFTDGREEHRDFGGVSALVRAWWDEGDLVIEREGPQGITVETYRLDERGPRLIVISEIRPHGGSGDRPRAIRIHRIYQRVEA